MNCTREKLQLRDFDKRLADQELKLAVDEGAMEVLVKDGYDPAFGARPVKRAIQRDLETPIARAIVAGKYPPGSLIRASVSDSKIVIQ